MCGSLAGSKGRGGKVLCDGGAGEGGHRENSHDCVGHSLRIHGHVSQVRQARLPLRLPAAVAPAAHCLDRPHPAGFTPAPLHPPACEPSNVPFLPKPEALSCIRKCFIDCPPVHRMVILYMTQPSGHQGHQWGQGCNPAGVVRTKQDPQFCPQLTPTPGPPSPQKERQPECH